MTRRDTFLRALLLACAVIVAGCGESLPVQEGPPDVVLEIAPNAEGGPVQTLPLDPGLAPTFQAGNLRAWSLEAVFGAAGRGTGVRLEVYDGADVRTLIDTPFHAEGGRVWVLRSNRKGEAQLSLVDPADPLPEFHGRGGNRGRSGDSTQRIHDVRRLRLVAVPRKADDRPAEGPASLQEAALALHVTVDGKEREVTPADLEGLKLIQFGGEGGMREAWPIHALATALGGPKARVAEVTAREGPGIVIPAEDWTNPAKVPLLRYNRRRQLKLHWVDQNLMRIRGPELREVSGFVILTQ